MADEPKSTRYAAQAETAAMAEAKATEEYYAADTLAEMVLAGIKESGGRGQEYHGVAVGYSESGGIITASYSVPIGGGMELAVEAEIGANGTHAVKWHAVNTREWREGGMEGGLWGW